MTPEFYQSFAEGGRLAHRLTYLTHDPGPVFTRDVRAGTMR